MPCHAEPFRVLVLDGLDPQGLDLLRAEPRLVVAERRDLDEAALAAEARDAAALLVRSRTRVTARVLAAAPALRLVGRPGAGVDNIDLAEAARRGVRVLSTPDAVTVSTAEHALALLMALARRIPQASSALRAGRWEKAGAAGMQLSGRTLGVVGFGRVGRAVAERARGLGMRLAAHDPAVPPGEIRRAGAEPMALEALLAASDAVTLHVPLTPQTQGMIGREALARMRPGALLVNCARGGLVDEEALAEALRAGRLGGAALDVFRREPPSPDHPLLGLDTLIATPHLGAATREAQALAARDLARQVVAFLLRGELPLDSGRGGG